MRRIALEQTQKVPPQAQKVPLTVALCRRAVNVSRLVGNLYDKRQATSSHESGGRRWRRPEGRGTRKTRQSGGGHAQQTAHARSETGEAITLTHTRSGPRKVGVGNSQRLRARSPQHPTHAKRTRKRLRGVKRRVRGSATALQHVHPGETNTDEKRKSY